MKPITTKSTNKEINQYLEENNLEFDPSQNRMKRLWQAIKHQESPEQNPDKEPAQKAAKHAPWTLKGRIQRGLEICKENGIDPPKNQTLEKIQKKLRKNGLEITFDFNAPTKPKAKPKAKTRFQKLSELLERNQIAFDQQATEADLIALCNQNNLEPPK